MSGATLFVVACGPTTSFQDAGRFGFQRYGVSSSGAMDRLALATANALVGNAPGAAALEFVLMGGTFRVEEGSARLALAGATFPVSVEGRLVASGTSFTLRAGQTVTLGPARAGTFAYLSVAGGLAVPTALGSLSLQPRAGLGGLGGRALRSGDRIPLSLATSPSGPEHVSPPLDLEPTAPVRVVLGPQDDHFEAEGLAALRERTFTVSNEADRMGYRLTGATIAHGPSGFNIVSDGIAAGSIQVPGSGEPIILMADRQTTGGYPKIATVISCDLRRVAQRRPGDRIRFEVVDMAFAQELARKRAALIVDLPRLLRPGGREGEVIGTAELLAHNLAGAAVDALADPF